MEQFRIRPASWLHVLPRLPLLKIHRRTPCSRAGEGAGRNSRSMGQTRVHSYINISIQMRHREKPWWCGHLTRPSKASLDTRRKKLFQLIGEGTPFLENSFSFHSFSCPATTSETAKWWRDMRKQNVWHYVNVYLSHFLSFSLLLFYETSCFLSLSLSLLKKREGFDFWRRYGGVFPVCQRSKSRWLGTG